MSGKRRGFGASGRMDRTGICIRAAQRLIADGTVAELERLKRRGANRLVLASTSQRKENVSVRTPSSGTNPSRTIPCVSAVKRRADLSRVGLGRRLCKRFGGGADCCLHSLRCAAAAALLERPCGKSVGRFVIGCAGGMVMVVVPMYASKRSSTRTCRTKRLIVMFALAVHAVPASAASLVPFAQDDTGRPVLEFYPATVAKFGAQGRDLVSLTIRETPPESTARAPIDLTLIVDCQSRQLAASQSIPAAKDGPPTTVSAFKFSDLKPPKGGMYERFVVALCDGELLAVQVLPAKSGWKHFLEGTRRALYVASDSTRKIGTYRVASVRLYELGGAQLPDGRHIDARDAVWVIDCERKLGAVAYERAFARVGDKNQTVESMGDEKTFANPSLVEMDKLTFGQPVPGSMQARFGEALCLENWNLQ